MLYYYIDQFELDNAITSIHTFENDIIFEIQKKLFVPGTSMNNLFISLLRKKLEN